MISLITVSLHFHISMLFIFLFSNNIQSRDLDMKPFLDTLLKAGTPQLAQKDWGYLPYILIMLGSSIWPLCWIYCNENKISFAQSTMMRGLASFGISYFFCQYQGSAKTLQFKDNIKILILRSVCMTSHSFCLGLAQFILPIPIVHTISCSGTLFIFIIDYFMHGITINPRQVIGIIIGLLGVFLVINGNLLTKWLDPSYEYKTAFQNYLFTDPFIITGFTVLYVIVTIIWAYASILTRLARANTFQINFVLGFAFYWLGFLCMPWMKGLGYTQSSFMEILKVFLFTGVPCFMVQVLIITSLTMTKQTGVLNIMSFAMIFVGYLVSIFRYHQTPNLICFVGIVLLVSGCVKTILFTKNK